MYLKYKYDNFHLKNPNISENEQRFLVPNYSFRLAELAYQKKKKKHILYFFFQPSPPLLPKLHSVAHNFLGFIYAN